MILGSVFGLGLVPALILFMNGFGTHTKYEGFQVFNLRAKYGVNGFGRHKIDATVFTLKMYKYSSTVYKSIVNLIACSCVKVNIRR